ncbi:HAD-IIIA family hydrolase [Pigmentibacter ruber]
MQQAVILAGGKGTRVAGISNGLPKALMPINEKPLIFYQLELIKKHNINDVLILTGYLSEKIEEELKDGSQFGLNIKYIKENKPLGTAGALLAAFDELKESFLVLYADTFLNIDFTKFHNFHRKKNSEISIFVHPNSHPHDSDIIEIDCNNLVTKFHSYPHPESLILPNLVNAALYIIEKKSLKNVINQNKSFDLCKDLFPSMLDMGCNIFAYNSPEYIKDMGTPERYNQVQKDLLNGIFAKGSFADPKKTIFLDRDGVINEEVSYISKPEQLQLIPGVSKTLKKINKSGYLAVLITNQPVVARGMCSLNELEKIHWHLETQLGLEGAYLDRIYYCPHHPDKGYKGENIEFKIDCDCRKPKLGMIKKAQEELNIDLSSSWFVGDSTTDLECAKRAGLKSVLVRTGLKGQDGKYPAKADFEFFNLEEAYDFITVKYESYINKLRGKLEELLSSSLIAIGGNSRSGKSSMASVLKVLLEKYGKKVTIVSLDNWLLSKEERKIENDVFASYDLESIKNILPKMKNFEENFVLDLPTYNRYTQTQERGNSLKIEIEKNSVLIFEGVIVLGIPEILNLFDHKIYVSISEEKRKERVLNEYILRGKSFEEAAKIYFDRFHSEYPIIDKMQNNADTILFLDA